MLPRANPISLSHHPILHNSTHGRTRASRPSQAFDMDAAFMSSQAHESGIHAVQPGAGEAGVTEVCFRPALRPVARPERATISSS
jgi:hypothetical protein